MSVSLSSTRKLLTAIAARLPARAAYASATMLAPVVLRTKGKRLRRDTAALFPGRDDEWVRDTARRQQIHRAWVALDKMLLARLSGDELLARVDPADIRDVRATCDSALAHGNGCVVLSMHYGRPMIGPRVFPLLGYPSTIVHAGMSRACLDWWAAGDSHRAYVEFIGARDPACARRSLRALARNRLLFVLVDGGIARRRNDVPFLGHTVSIPEPLTRMAVIARSAVITGTVRSTEALRFRMAVRVVTHSAERVTAGPLGALVAAEFEAAVLEDPGQWYGINRMFRFAGRSPAAEARRVMALTAAD